MAKIDEGVRIYRIPDAEMIQQCRVFHGLFVDDKPEFINLDVDFNDPFSDNWLKAIEDARNAVQYLSVKNELAMLTGVVYAKMELCRTHYQRMKYYIEKAFPSNKKLWDAFGYSAYDFARQSDVKLIQFMKTLHTQAVKNSAKLIEAGFKQADIDRIAELGKELSDAGDAQENYKSDRIFITQERIATMNNAWEFVLKVNKASKNIFMDKYVKLHQYLLPGETTAEKQTAETEIQTPAK